MPSKSAIFWAISVLVAGVLGGLVGGMVSNQANADSIQGLIKAKGFELIDPLGMSRGGIMMDDKGNPSLTILDRKKRSMVRVTATVDGPKIELLDKNEMARIRMALQGHETGYFKIADEKGKPLVSLDGFILNHGIHINGKEKYLSLTIEQFDNPVMRLHGKNESNPFALGLTDNGLALKWEDPRGGKPYNSGDMHSALDLGRKAIDAAAKELSGQ